MTFALEGRALTQALSSAFGKEMAKKILSIAFLRELKDITEDGVGKVFANLDYRCDKRLG